jgi:hypothetical protein
VLSTLDEAVTDDEAVDDADSELFDEHATSGLIAAAMTAVTDSVRYDKVSIDARLPLGRQPMAAVTGRDSR